MPDYLTTRAAARAAGNKHYFTDKKCVRGHQAPRFTSTGGCTECNTENMRPDLIKLVVYVHPRDAEPLRLYLTNLRMGMIVDYDN